MEEKVSKAISYLFVYVKLCLYDVFTKDEKLKYLDEQKYKLQVKENKQRKNLGKDRNMHSYGVYTNKVATLEDRRKNSGTSITIRSKRKQEDAIRYKYKNL